MSIGWNNRIRSKISGNKDVSINSIKTSSIKLKMAAYY